MAGPWEDFQQPSTTPPWEDFKTPAQTEPAPSWTSTAAQSARDLTQHLLHGFGVGARQAFGDEPVSTPETSLSPETIKSLKDAGIFNDYQKGQNSFLRNLAEGTARFVAATAEGLTRSVAAVAGGYLGAAAEVGEATGLAEPGTLTGEEGLVGAATDPGLMMLAGPLGEAEAANAMRLRNLKTTVSKARAAGAIGEGDAEFYGAAKPAPEALQQRVEAAKEAGIPPSPPLPAAKDPHELARRIEPEAFQQYDELAVKKDQLRQTIEKLLAENPEPVQLPWPKGIPEQIFHGSGGKKLMNFEGEPLLPVLGEGKYFAFKKEHAEKFGPNIETATKPLNNPLVINSDEQWRALTRKAGWEFPNPSGIPNTQLKPMIDKLQAIIKERGHDGVIIDFPEDYTGDEYKGRSIKTLRDVFDVPQAVVFTKTKGTPYIPAVSKAYNDLLDADAKQQELLPTLRAAYDKAGGILPEDQLALAFANKSAREEDELNVIRDKAEAGRKVSAQLPGGNDTPLKTGKLPENAFENKENIVEPGPLVAEYEQELKATGVPEVAPVPGRYTGLRPVEGTGETRVRGLAAGVEEKALENKLTEGFGDLPEYKTLNMADQAQKAIAFVGKDFEAAKDVAMGRKQPPPGLAVASVFKAVEDAATNKGDVKLISDLGQRSKVLAQITTMAQNIRVLAERDPISPVGAIQELVRARTEAYGKGLDAAHAQTVKDIKDTMGKAASPVSKWEQFIQSIACKE